MYTQSATQQYCGYVQYLSMAARHLPVFVLSPLCACCNVWLQALSNLSPWLHFGQLSPQRAALEAAKMRPKFKESVEGFLEELVSTRSVLAWPLPAFCSLRQVCHVAPLLTDGQMRTFAGCGIHMLQC